MTKKNILILICVLFAGINTSFSQAFKGKGAKNIQVGLGLTDHYAWYPENGKGPKGIHSTVSGQLSFQMEFGIGKYVGLGGYLGVAFASRFSNSGNILFLPYSSNNFWSLEVPIGITANFHFFQLIGDKSSSGNVPSDKLDIYVGANLGSGVAFVFDKSPNKTYGNDVGALIQGGPHVGIGFYPNSNIGFYMELGYGKSYLNGGLTIKL